MQLQEILDKAQADPQFAEELRDKLERACASGPGTPEWEEYGKYFAGDEEQLANFNASTQEVGEGQGKHSHTAPTTPLTPRIFRSVFGCQ